MDKVAIMKWVKFISFAFVLIGGINWLLIGLFEFDLFATMFGGMESVASRIFYVLFGLGAVVLLTTVLIKAFSKESKKTKTSEA